MTWALKKKVSFESNRKKRADWILRTARANRLAGAVSAVHLGPVIDADPAAVVPALLANDGTSLVHLAAVAGLIAIVTVVAHVPNDSLVAANVSIEIAPDL